MKTTITLFAICFLGAFSVCNAQNSQTSLDKELVKKDTAKQMNLLDEQTKILGQMFSLGGAEEDNPFAGTTNYLELIEKTEMPEEQKQEIRELYEIYDLSLDPKKKAEFELKLNKKLEGGIRKAQIQQ